MKAYCEKRGVEPQHFAVAWVLNNKLISGVVAGPRTEAQWDGYAKALDCKITKEDEAFINESGRRPAIRRRPATTIRPIRSRGRHGLAERYDPLRCRT